MDSSEIDNAKRIPAESDLGKLIEFIQQLPIEKNIKPDEFGYENPILILLDAVLSINRQYYPFVVPRINDFQKRYPEINNLNSLVDLINSVGIDNFNIVWNYNHPERVKILLDLTNKFISYRNKIMLIDDLQTMKHYASNTSVYDYKNFNVKGIGLATFQYLRMMLGVSTIKPDVHIKKAISKVLNRKIGDLEVIDLLETACKALEIPATTIDHNIWLYSQNNSRS